MVFSNPYFNNPQPSQSFRMPTMQDKVNIICQSLGATEVVKVEEFSETTRHICLNGNRIYILSKAVFPINTPLGVIGVEYMFCPSCRKLILNRSTLV